MEGKKHDYVKLLGDPQTRWRGGRENLPQIAKDKKGAIRSFCLVTFIVSPVLMAEQVPPTSPLLGNQPPPTAYPTHHTQTPRWTLCHTHI